MIFTEDELKCAASGDPETLMNLDERGFIIGPEEDARRYATRLASLEINISEIEEQLSAEGTLDMAGFSLSSEQRIPPELFEEVAEKTKTLYRFSVDWVPGFFINPKFSWLFGGCAIYGVDPDFFALFIIRKSFEKNPNWLIYNRDELLSHELCHIARIAFEGNVYEETNAYQTASSKFRRNYGGLFRTQADTFILLGSTFLLFITQIFRVLYMPALAPAVMACWGILIAFAAWIFLRHKVGIGKRARAINNLSTVAGENAEAVCFRCTDEEVYQIAALSADSVKEYIAKKAGENLRWSVINHRFVKS